MNNDNGGKKSSTTIIVIILAVLLFIGILSSANNKTEYEEAGDSFNTWAKTDPNSWTSTQKEYYNDVFDYASKNP